MGAKAMLQAVFSASEPSDMVRTEISWQWMQDEFFAPKILLDDMQGRP